MYKDNVYIYYFLSPCKRVYILLNQQITFGLYFVTENVYFVKRNEKGVSFFSIFTSSLISALSFLVPTVYDIFTSPIPKKIS